MLLSTPDDSVAGEGPVVGIHSERQFRDPDNVKYFNYFFYRQDGVGIGECGAKLRSDILATLDAKI